MLFLSAFVIYNDKCLLVYRRYAFFFCYFHHLCQSGFQKYAWDFDKLCARLVCESDGWIYALCAVDDGLDVAFMLRDFLWEWFLCPES